MLNQLMVAFLKFTPINVEPENSLLLDLLLKFDCSKHLEDLLHTNLPKKRRFEKVPNANIEFIIILYQS